MNGILNSGVTLEFQPIRGTHCWLLACMQVWLHSLSNRLTAKQQHMQTLIWDHKHSLGRVTATLKRKISQRGDEAKNCSLGKTVNMFYCKVQCLTHPLF